MANINTLLFWRRLSAALLFLYVSFSLVILLDKFILEPGVRQRPGTVDTPRISFSSGEYIDQQQYGNSAPSRPAGLAEEENVTTVPGTSSIGSSTSTGYSNWKGVEYCDRTLPTPIRHRVLTNSNHLRSPTLLVLVMTKDSSSWGPGRKFASFLEMLKWTELDPATVSLSLLTSSEEEFETYSAEALNTDYASVRVIYHPGYQDIGSSRLFRHMGSVQHSRRVEMARLRNYASLTSLELYHEHLLWIDADVYEISTGLVQNMLNFSSVYPQVGIQTAVSHWGEDNGDYDFNAWVGSRKSPDAAQRERLRKDKSSWVPSDVPGEMKHMGDLRKEFEEARRKKGGKGQNEQEQEQDEEAASTATDEKEDSLEHVEGLFRLDAVGATILLMKSHLWRQGLAFATSYLVGTDFQDEGWDGVESEGLCVAARNLINEEQGRQGGVGCWGVADGYTRHSDGWRHSDG